MLIARAPLRLGLVGGGSDLPSFFERSPKGGAVLGMAIDKYVYVTLLPLAEIARERIRFTYRNTESVQRASELRHPVLKAVLSEMADLDLLNVGTMADLPGETGLGSSSAFTVALLHCLLTVTEKTPTATDLAREAIRIERQVLGESGGWQDQLQSAFGGMRLYEFGLNGFRVSEPLPTEKVLTLASSLSLEYHGGQRRSHDSQVELDDRIMSGAATQPLTELSELARSTWRSLNKVEEPRLLIAIMAEALNESRRLKAESIGRRSADFEPGNGVLAQKPLGADGGSFTLYVRSTSWPRQVALGPEGGVILPVNASLSGSVLQHF